MFYHSVIIPCFAREANLDRCLRSLKESAKETGLLDFEAIVAGKIEEDWLTRFQANYRFFRYVECETTPPGIGLYPKEEPPYWKTRALNAAMLRSKGDVLTFLDADSIVGKMFLQGAGFCYASGITRLCYRVRKLPPEHAADFTMFDQYPKAFEAYGRLDKGEGVFCLPVYGNSQFTASRGVMDDVGPWDEDYFGRGFEDLDMIRRIERQNTPYHAAIMNAADYAMFHSVHPDSPGFGNGRWNDRAERKFYGIRTAWLFYQSGVSPQAASEAWCAMNTKGWRLKITANEMFSFVKPEILPRDVHWSMNEKSLSQLENALFLGENHE